MAQDKRTIWPWTGLGILFLAIGIGVLVAYAPFAVDGATGDLGSFSPEGFRIQWLLEERQGGLRVGDLVVRAGGHTPEEWLEGAPRGSAWQEGSVVRYEIVRDGRPMVLSIELAPIPFHAILGRWAPQFLASLAMLGIGAFVFWKRPQEAAARVLMLFCVTVAVQLWVDAYNVQVATLPGRWRFWLHLIVEHGTFVMNYAAICHFVLVFPHPHPLLKRYPRLAPLALYGANPVVIAITTLLPPTWSQGLRLGNQFSFVVVILQIGLAIVAGLRSVRTTRDPVAKAQIRWIFWGGGVAITVALLGYILPLMITGQPLLPHPLSMLLTALIPYVLGLAVLRYRLFEIDVLIHRTLVYGTLMFLLAGVYLLLARLLLLVLQGIVPQESNTIAVFAATTTVALIFVPLRERVQLLIDRTFYRTKLDFQRLMPELSARVASCILIDELADLLTEKLPQQLQITWATLLVLDSSGYQFQAVGNNPGAPDTLAAEHPLPKRLERQGEPLTRQQPPSDLPAGASDYLEQHRIEVWIPLRAGPELIGLYGLGPKYSGRPYLDEEIHLLHLLGRQAAVAVENSRLLQAANRQAEEMAILHSAASAVSSSLELEEVLYTLAEQLGRALYASGVYICDWQASDSQSTVLAEWIRPPADELPSRVGSTVDLREHPAILEGLRSKEPLIADGMDDVPRASLERRRNRSAHRAYIAIPLTIRDRVIGYAEVWETRQERLFTEADLRLSQILAAEAAVAIEHARLFQAERQQRELTKALQEAAAAVSSTLDLDLVLDRILKQVARVVSGDAFNIMLIQGDRARVVRGQGYEALGGANEITQITLPLSRYQILATMRKKQKPIVVHNIEEDPRWIHDDGWKWQRSYVGAPIYLSGTVTGFLNVDGTRVGQFTAADAQRLMAFADHAGTAIENAWLFQESQRRTAYLELHNALIAAAAAASDLPELLGIALDGTLKALGLDAGYIWVADEQVVRHLPAESGWAIDLMVQSFNEEGTEPIVVPDWQQVEPQEPLGTIGPIVECAGIRASITVSILSEGQRIGGLTLTAPVPRRWTEEDVSLLKAIGRQLGGAAERLRLLDRIREQAQQFQQLIDTVPEGVLLLAADRSIVLVNPTAREYLSVLANATKQGERLHQLGDQPIDEVLSPLPPGRWHEIRVPGSSERIFEATARPLTVGGASDDAVLLIRDVTQERAIQQQIQQQDRLAAVGQLAGGVAHDFNNILTTIILGIQTLLYSPSLPQSHIPELQTILTESQKAAHLVRQILDFSRRSWIDIHPIDMKTFIGEVVQILRRTLPANIEIVLETGPQTYTVQADPTRIQQVVMNLALNARDAMPEGGELRIGLFREQTEEEPEAAIANMPPGQWACLSISDTGPGIPDDVKPHLFEPFFTTKPPGEGTGLGLAQVYGIVKQHQGYVFVDSEEDAGCTCRIYLPMEGKSLAAKADSEQPPPLPQGQGETILLVEDDQQVQQLCRQILSSRGYRVITANDGQEALEIYRANDRIDLVFTDVVMPRMGARRMLQELQKIDPQVKVVVMTGYALKAEHEGLLEAGVSEILPKPVDMRSLIHTVRRALDAQPE